MDFTPTVESKAKKQQQTEAFEFYQRRETSCENSALIQRPMIYVDGNHVRLLDC
jgi:hypothetical protein